MTLHNKRALECAKVDAVFARILTALEPIKAMNKQERYEWSGITKRFITTAWVIPALDAREGRFNTPSDYSCDPLEQGEIEKVQNHIRRFNEYADLLAGTREKPFTDYLNGITVEDFRCLLVNKRGMDAAREIQILYRNQTLSDDLGGSQLYRYMEQLGLPYIPTINHLNAARRGEISKGRYNMKKSREVEERYILKKMAQNS